MCRWVSAIGIQQRPATRAVLFQQVRERRSFHPPQLSLFRNAGGWYELVIAVSGRRLSTLLLQLTDSNRHARLALFIPGRATDRDTLAGRCSGLGRRNHQTCKDQFGSRYVVTKRRCGQRALSGCQRLCGASPLCCAVTMRLLPQSSYATSVSSRNNFGLSKLQPFFFAHFAKACHFFAASLQATS